jgi:hypothetical protein
VLALGAAGCIPFWSCNGGAFGGDHSSPVPTVKFFAKAEHVTGDVPIGGAPATRNAHERRSSCHDRFASETGQRRAHFSASLPRPSERKRDGPSRSRHPHAGLRAAKNRGDGRLRAVTPGPDHQRPSKPLPSLPWAHQ